MGVEHRVVDRHFKFFFGEPEFVAGDPLRRADGLKFLGIIQRAQGHLTLAEQSLTTASLLAEESEDVLLAAEVARELGETQASMGEISEAKRFLERSLELIQGLNAGLDVTEDQERLEQIQKATL